MTPKRSLNGGRFSLRHFSPASRSALVALRNSRSMIGDSSQEHRPEFIGSGESLSPQTGSVSLFEDPDSQLQLRGSSFIRPKSSAELMERWLELPDDIRERAVHELGIGKPRPCLDDDGNPRFPTAEEVGIHRDDRGLVVVAPDDPTLRDRDLDERLVDKSPEEIAAYLKAVDDGTDPGSGYLGDTVENLMAREIDPKGGGGSKNRKQKKPAPTSIIDRTAAYASEKRLAG